MKKSNNGKITKSCRGFKTQTRRQDAARKLDTPSQFLSGRERMSQPVRGPFVIAETEEVPMPHTFAEECGLSRIPLGGLAQKLHQANLLTLYDIYRSEMKARRGA